MPVRRFVQRLERLKDQLMNESHRFVENPKLLRQKIHALIKAHDDANAHVQKLQQKERTESLTRSEESQIRRFLKARQELQIISEALVEHEEKFKPQLPGQN